MKTYFFTANKDGDTIETFATFDDVKPKEDYEWIYEITTEGVIVGKGKSVSNLFPIRGRGPKYFFRTVSESGEVLETWKESWEVKPKLDYARIETVVNGEVSSTYKSLFDFLNVPF